MFSVQGISASLLIMGMHRRVHRERVIYERVVVIIFSWSSLPTYLKKFEKVDSVDEEFLHNKIKNKELCVDYSATEDIPEDGCS